MGSLTLELDHPTPFSDVQRDYLTPLRHLVQFGTGEETRLQSLVLTDLDESDPRVSEARTDTELIIRFDIQPLTPRQNPYDHLLMPFAAWSDDPVAFLQRWLRLHARLCKAANLLFATLNVRYIYLENQLLNLTTFAEAYHRTLHDDPPISESDHAQHVQEMIGVLSSPTLQNHYRARLTFAYEQSLRSRLKWLFRRAESADERVKDWRKEDLPDKLVATRNSLAHRAGEDGETLEDSELFRAMRRLSVVLQINLMLDLEMADDAVRACIAERYITSVGLWS